MRTKDSILLLIEHERSNGLTLVGMDPSLSMNADGIMHWGQRGCYPGGKLRVY